MTLLPPGETWGSEIGQCIPSHGLFDRTSMADIGSCIMSASSMSALDSSQCQVFSDVHRLFRVYILKFVSPDVRLVVRVMNCLVNKPPKMATVCYRKKSRQMTGTKDLTQENSNAPYRSAFQRICSMQSASPASWMLICPSRSIGFDPGTG